MVSNIEGVVVMARRMLPFTAKKRIELKAILDYYEDRITGNQFVDTMNRLVIEGEMAGKDKGSGPNFTYFDGVRESRRLRKKAG
jgi:hypothetical protein